jgi:hypothetical protein
VKREDNSPEISPLSMLFYFCLGLLILQRSSVTDPGSCAFHPLGPWIRDDELFPDPDELSFSLLGLSPEAIKSKTVII